MNTIDILLTLKQHGIEIEGIIDGSIDISYDNTLSGLTSTTIKSAIDELEAALSAIDAVDVLYDNTLSGLTAIDVQNAIDELKTLLDNEAAKTAIDIPITNTTDFTATDVEGALAELAQKGLKKANVDVAQAAWVANTTVDGDGNPIDYTINIQHNLNSELLIISALAVSSKESFMMPFTVVDVNNIKLTLLEVNDDYKINILDVK